MSAAALTAAIAGGRRRFTTASLPGRVLDLDANYVTGVADGGAVATWPDISDLGNHAVQATGAKQGLLRVNGIGRDNAIELDGIDDGYLTALATTIGKFTVAIISKLTGTAGMLWESGISISWVYGTTGATLQASRGGVVSSKERAANWSVDNQAKVTIVTFDGTHAGHKMFINGAEQSMTTSVGNSPGTATVSNVCAIGHRSTGSLFCTGRISKVTVYNDAYAGVDLANLTAYLRARAGV